MDSHSSSEVTVGSLAFTGLLWLLTGYLALEALSFPFEARLAPLLFGGIGFALLTYLLGRDAIRLRAGPVATSRADVDEPRAASSTGSEMLRREESSDSSRDEAIALAWVIGSVFVVLVFGFVIGMTISMLAIVRLFARERLATAVALTVGVMAILWVVFGELLNVALFPGLLGILD